MSSEAEELLYKALTDNPLDGWDLTREYRFHAVRKWRFDMAFPSQKLGVEVNGRGRHQTVKGVSDDCEKHNEAVRLGWRVLMFPANEKRKAAEWAALIVEVLCVNPTGSEAPSPATPR